MMKGNRRVGLGVVAALGGLALVASFLLLSPAPPSPPPSVTGPSAMPSAITPPAFASVNNPSAQRAKAEELRAALMARHISQISDDEPAADAARPLGSKQVQGEAEGNTEADEMLHAYVNRLMQDHFIPLTSDCYETLLSRIPGTAGSVELHLSIMGEREGGGVVVDARLGAGSTLTDRRFSTCVTEALYGIVFEPPPQGRPTVSVKQSLELSP